MATNRYLMATTSAALMALTVAVVLGGCSVQRGDANEVVIEHLAQHPGFAELLADDHCAKFGKRARPVQMSNTQPTFLALQGRLSTFACITPEVPPSAGSTGGK